MARTSDLKRKHQELLLMAYRASNNGSIELEKEYLAEAKKVQKIIEKIEQKGK